MGLLKTENHTHNHISEKAAKELRKGQEKSARITADAEAERARIIAKGQVETVREQRLAQNDIAHRAEKASALERYRELANKGTAAAFMQLYKAKESAPYISKGGRPSEEEMEEILQGFEYTKIPGEFRKIYIYLRNEEKDLKEMLNIAEMNSHDPDIASLLDEIREEKRKQDEREKANDKQLMMIAIGSIALLILGGIIASIFG